MHSFFLKRVSQGLDLRRRTRPIWVASGRVLPSVLRLELEREFAGAPFLPSGLAKPPRRRAGTVVYGVLERGER